MSVSTENNAVLPTSQSRKLHEQFLSVLFAICRGNMSDIPKLVDESRALLDEIQDDFFKLSDESMTHEQAIEISGELAKKGIPHNFVKISEQCYCISVEKEHLQVAASIPPKTNEQIRIANLERSLFTLKGIAQGYGTDPRIYAQNTLDDIGESY